LSLLCKTLWGVDGLKLPWRLESQARKSSNSR
jgi:hypothetical protein